MSEESLTTKSARNAIVSVTGQAVIIALGFATRSVFIYTLGVELLGLNTVLTSLMAVVYLADLGMSWAIMHALYRPLVDGEDERVSAIVAFAGVLYRRVAIGAGLIGLAIYPFLDVIVSADVDIQKLQIYYGVLLLGTLLSYPMTQRYVLLAADQRIYWAKMVLIGINVLRSASQICALLIWESFLLFVIIQSAGGVLYNFVVYWKVGKDYPHLASKPALGQEERRSLSTGVWSMMVYHFASVVLNSSPAILISALIGTVALGYYSNYLLVLASIAMVLQVAFEALIPSIGRLVSNREGARRIFDEIQLAAILIYGAFAVALFVGISDFVEIWLGYRYVMSISVIAAAVLNFYVVGSMMPVLLFRSTTGLFRRYKYLLAVTAFLNLVLAFAMGHVWGIAGILFATPLARLVSVAWVEPLLLFSKFIGGSLVRYFWIHLKGVAVALASIASVELLFPDGPAMTWVTPRAVCGMTIFALGMWGVFGRSDQWGALVARGKGISGRVRGRRRLGA